MTCGNVGDFDATPNCFKKSVLRPIMSRALHNCYFSIATCNNVATLYFHKKNHLIGLFVRQIIKQSRYYQGLTTSFQLHLNLAKLNFKFKIYYAKYGQYEPQKFAVVKFWGRPVARSQDNVIYQIRNFFKRLKKLL